LDLGRTLFTADGFQDMRSTAAKFELVFFNMHRIQIIIDPNVRKNGDYDLAPVAKSCSLEIRKQLAKNQAKYYPHIKIYNEFLDGEELRLLEKYIRRP
jgi:NLR family CARD domain-containing protein 3